MSTCPDCGGPRGRQATRCAGCEDTRRGRGPSAIRAYILAHPTAAASIAAAALGIKPSTYRKHRSRLIKAGVVARLRQTLDYAAIAELYADGLLTPQVTRAIGASAYSIASQLKRRAQRVEDYQAGVMTGHDLAAALGYSRNYASRLIPRLTAAGLRVRRLRGRQRSHWRCTEADLMAWLLSDAAAPFRARLSPEWRAYLDETGTAAPRPLRDRDILTERRREPTP